MTQTLTPDYQTANISPFESDVSWADFAAEMVGQKKRFRAAERPVWVGIPRNALRDVRLRETSATLLGLLIYLHQHEGRVALSRIAGWLKKDRSTICRHAQTLQRLKLVDTELRPVENFDELLWPRDRAPGHLRFEFRMLDELGDLKLAIAHEQLQEVPSLGVVRRHLDPDGGFPCVGKLFARLIGSTAKTAYKRLTALASRTIQLGKHAGHASIVHLLGERAWKRPPKPAKAAPKSKAPELGKASTPPPMFEGDVLASQTEQLLERLRHGAGPQPPPAPELVTKP
jgi:hypothetical protein